MSERVPMPSPVITVRDDPSSAGPTFSYGRRFSMTVAEDVLQRLAPEVMPYVVERLAKQIAHEHYADVRASVHEWLRNHAWAEPIIRDAIREVVREIITGMLASSAFSDLGRPPREPGHGSA